MDWQLGRIKFYRDVSGANSCISMLPVVGIGHYSDKRVRIGRQLQLKGTIRRKHFV